MGDDSLLDVLDAHHLTELTRHDLFHDRASLVHATCHELRHTCFTRPREADSARGDPGPGRAPLDRINPVVSAPIERLASRRIPEGRGVDRRFDDPGAGPMTGSVATHDSQTVGPGWETIVQQRPPAGRHHMPFPGPDCALVTARHPDQDRSGADRVLPAPTGQPFPKWPASRTSNEPTSSRSNSPKPPGAPPDASS
jgi:hypothetical protein